MVDPGPSGNPPHERAETSSAEVIRAFLWREPHLSQLIHRILREELLKAGHASFEQIVEAAGLQLSTSAFPADTHERRWTRAERDQLNQTGGAMAAQYFSPDHLDSILSAAVLSAREGTLADYLLDPRVKINGPDLVRKLEQFCTPPSALDEDDRWDPESRLSPADAEGVKVRLTTLLLTDDIRLVEVAKKILTVDDFLQIARSTITTDDGIGKLGGKMAGLILRYKALTLDVDLARDKLGLALEPDPHPDYLPIRMPEATTLTAEDVFEAVLRWNNMTDYRTFKRKPLDEIRALQSSVIDDFRNIEFPPDVEQKLIRFIDSIEGKGPYMVRSSSVLEDSTTASFTGIYNSVVFVNQGTREERLTQLKAAIGEVYASTYSEPAISYRRDGEDQGLLDLEENMGVSIQRMVGRQHGKYFFPAISGVGFSYARHAPPGFDPNQGMVSLALGHGKAVVDQGADNPIRDVFLSDPTRRPHLNNSGDELIKAAQRKVFGVNMENCTFERMDFFDLQSEMPIPDEFAQILSRQSGGRLYPGTFGYPLYITFDGLTADPRFGEKMRWMLKRMRDVFDQDVDMEFAAYPGGEFTLLQGRHEKILRELSSVDLPQHVAPDQLLFDVKDQGDVPMVRLDKLTHLVYVRPDAYAALQHGGTRAVVEGRILKVVEAIRSLNAILEPKSFVLMGPGRWGTNLDESANGPPVQNFSDLRNTALLCEIIDTRNGLAFATASGGSHWATRLNEAKVYVLVLNAGRDGTLINDSLLGGPNELQNLIDPGLASEIGGVIHVVDVRKLTGDDRARLHYVGSRKEGKALMWVD